MSRYYSRQQLYALGEPFGDSATQVKPGGQGRIYGGGGGGGGSSTTGPQGGGGGGGGGGYGGGVGGNQYGGNDGGYSGSNGNCIVPAGFTVSSVATNLSEPTTGSVVIQYANPERLFSGGEIDFDGTTWTHTFNVDSEGVFSTKGAPGSFGPFVPIAQGWANMGGTWKQFYPSTGAVTFKPTGKLDITTPQVTETDVSPSEIAFLAQGVDQTNAGVLDYKTSKMVANQPFYLSRVNPWPVTAAQVITDGALTDGTVVVVDADYNPISFADSTNPVSDFLSVVFDPTYVNYPQENSFITALQAAYYVQATDNSITGTVNTYTWTVPQGIYQITVDAVGGGGGGGGAEEVGNGDAGGGGGSGGYVQGKTMIVSPGEQLSITIGLGGPGAVYVGRTTSAPSGSSGGATAVSGLDGHIVVTGGAGGVGGTMSESGGSDGGGGGGGKIICRKLAELGYFDRYMNEADQRFGVQLRERDPNAYYGYLRWAQTVVDLMDGKGSEGLRKFVFFWERDAQRRIEMQKKIVIYYMDMLARPWAEEMAFRMGAKGYEKSNPAGRIIMNIGLPLCRKIGKIQSKQNLPLFAKICLIWGTVSVLLASVLTVSGVNKILSWFKKGK